MAVMNSIQICGYKFEHVATINDYLKKDGNNIYIYEPLKDSNNKYLNNNNYVLNAPCKALNDVKELKFCSFDIPKITSESCVYALYVDGDLKYIGSASNFDKRWGKANYAKITARNIYTHNVGGKKIPGQSTNCKINNYICIACLAGKTCDLYIYTTQNFKADEAYLIDTYNKQCSGELINTQLKSRKFRNTAISLNFKPVQNP